MKKEILAALKEKDLNQISELARHNKSILTKLLARTYDNNDEIRWQAVEGLGVAASIWVIKDLEFVKNFCRRLVWMLNDESGNMGWFAPQALGAILAENHEPLKDFIPLLLAVLDEKNEPEITTGTLWAVERIGPVNPEFTQAALQKVRPYLYSTITAIQEQAQKSYQKLARNAN